MYRNRYGLRWSQTATLYVLSSLFAATLAGAVLGFLGSRLHPSLKPLLDSVIGISALLLGGLYLFGTRRPPPQRDRETPFAWVEGGPIGWAVRTGAALGLGITTRIGFWSWFLVPLGAILTGQVVGGASVYGTYGFTRAMGAVVVLGVARVRQKRVQEIGNWLVTRLSRTIRYSSLHMLVVGLLLLILP